MFSPAPTRPGVPSARPSLRSSDARPPPLLPLVFPLFLEFPASPPRFSPLVFRPVFCFWRARSEAVPPCPLLVCSTPPHSLSCSPLLPSYHVIGPLNSLPHCRLARPRPPPITVLKSKHSHKNFTYSPTQPLSHHSTDHTYWAAQTQRRGKQSIYRRSLAYKKVRQEERKAVKLRRKLESAASSSDAAYKPAGPSACKGAAGMCSCGVLSKCATVACPCRAAAVMCTSLCHGGKAANKCERRAFEPAAPAIASDSSSAGNGTDSEEESEVHSEMSCGCAPEDEL